MEGHITVRTEVSVSNPAGKSWATIDGDMKSLSVSSKGHVWAVNKGDKIWYRKGSKLDSPMGSTWKAVAGSLKHVSIGPLGVWGIDAKNEVYFREGTFGDPEDCEGKEWLKIEGKFIDLCVGTTTVWALGSNRDIYYRVGTHEGPGTHWCR